MSTKGRRSTRADTRSDLIEAGKQCLARAPLHPLSVREVAETGGATPAMVRYFFGDRLGFLRALMDDGFATLAETVPEDGGFSEIIGALQEMTARQPWLPALLIQTVYLGDTLRAHFEQTHAPRLGGFYRQALERGKARGEVDPTLPDGPAIAALISLVVFPAMAGASLAPVLANDDPAQFQHDLRALIPTLFRPKELLT